MYTLNDFKKQEQTTMEFHTENIRGMKAKADFYKMAAFCMFLLSVGAFAKLIS